MPCQATLNILNQPQARCRAISTLLAALQAFLGHIIRRLAGLGYLPPGSEKRLINQAAGHTRALSLRGKRRSLPGLPGSQATWSGDERLCKSCFLTGHRTLCKSSHVFSRSCVLACIAPNPSRGVAPFSRSLSLSLSHSHSLSLTHSLFLSSFLRT